MTTRPTRIGLLQRASDFADFMGGIRSCAAAAQARRRPSRAALTAIGLNPDNYDVAD